MVVEQIRTLLRDTADAGDAEFSVERPKKAEHGDYASNIALVLGKKRGTNPKSLAEEMSQQLSKEDLFAKVEVAGPGFINLQLSPAAWQGAVQEIVDAKGKFGTLEQNKQFVVLEYMDVNPTGPAHLGHGRSAFSGDVLARVMRRAGYKVETDHLINDAGNQILELGKTVKGEEKLYAGDYIDEVKQQVDTKGSAQEVGERAAEVLLKEIQATCKRMGVEFDVWFSERKELHQTGEIKQVLDDLERIDATYEKDDALWLKTTHWGDDKDRVLRKSDGELTYLAADLAYHFNKLVKRKADLVVNIFGADHHGYVKRMEAGVEFLRKTEHFDGKFKILIMQLVRLIRSGKEVKMSKRAGNFVSLDELLDEVEPDVARFFFVMRSLDTHMDFDLDLAKEQSKKNPVWYLKYAYARIAGILKKGGKAAKKKDADLAKLTDPAEFALVKELAEFPEVIRQTATDYQVQRVAHYALAIADAFHKFYEQCPVISDDTELTAARLKLIEATKLTLDQVGATLGIELPEKM